MFLMLGLSLPERAGRRNFRLGLAWPEPGSFNIGDRGCGGALLFWAGMGHRGAIAEPPPDHDRVLAKVGHLRLGPDDNY
jgi:hypothetical protein